MWRGEGNEHEAEKRLGAHCVAGAEGGGET